MSNVGTGWFKAGGPWMRVVYVLAILAVWVAIALVATVLVFSQGLPDISRLYTIQRQPSINYLDRSGALITVRGSQYAPPVKIDEMPPYVPAAFVAIEDRRFYHHLGFDMIGITGRRSIVGHQVELLQFVMARQRPLEVAPAIGDIEPTAG